MSRIARLSDAAVRPRGARVALLLGIGAAALLSACESGDLDGSTGVGLDDSGGPQLAAGPAAGPVEVPQGAVDALLALGEVEVLLEVDRVDLSDAEVSGVLDELGLDPAELPRLEGPARARLDVALREAEADVLADVFDGLTARLPASAELGRRYRHVPLMMVRVSRIEALQALARDPAVLAIYEQQVYEPVLTQSLDLINQPEAAAAGHTGAGVAVAVLDTGLDYTRSAFGSCSAPGAGGACRVVAVADFAPADGVRDTGSFHGTNVAGIVAGVAPGASLIGLDVFRADGGGYTSDIVAAIDWVIANKDVYNIAVMNLSLGGGAFTSLCPSDPFEVALGRAKDAGVAAAVATGNNGYTNKVASPACAPSAIRVGAVYDSNIGGVNWSGCSDVTTAADKVTCFSNSTSFVDLLAPGALITAAGITQGGTSQATPHVAGALAVMRGAFPLEGIDDHVDRLASTGRPVTDHRNGLIFPRIDVEAAVAGAGLDCRVTLSGAPSALSAGAGSSTVSVGVQAGCPWTARADDGWLVASPSVGTGPGSFTLSRASNGGGARSTRLVVGDAEATISQAGNDTPTVSFSIAGGAAFTPSRAVSLQIGASDSGAVTHMCVSTSTSCSWVPYAETLSYTLPSRDGEKVLRVRVKDEHGAISDWAEDSIVVDSGAPVGGSLSVSPASGGVDVQWSGFTDALSGVASVKVVKAEGDVAPDCAGAASLTGGAEGQGSIAGLTNGRAYSLRACATDGAGNVAASPVYFVVPNAPADAGAAVSINGGDEVTRSRTVQLSFNAPSGATQYCVSNTANCTRFRPLVSTLRWSLPSAQGNQTVLAWFKDAAGNVTGPFGDSVLLDSVRPSNGEVTVEREDGALELSWSGFEDAGSGVVGYRVYTQAKKAPSCGRGTLAYEGAEAEARVDGLVNGAPVGLRVCAVDAAGNLSTGVAVVTSAASEGVAPTGSVSVSGGAEYVKGRVVELSLAASDESGVTHMCVSNTTRCTSFRVFSPTLRWTMGGANGEQTVYVSYRDANGNVSEPVTDSVITDSLRPSGGALTAAPISGGARLSWSGIVENGSGLAEVRVRYAEGTRAPSCTSGVDAGSSEGSALEVSGLTSGRVYTFRACPVDAVGNVGSGLVKAVTAG